MKAFLQIFSITSKERTKAPTGSVAQTRVLPPWFSLRVILAAAATARLGALLILHNFSNPKFFEWGDVIRKYLAGRGFSYYTANGIDVPTAYMPPAYSYILWLMFTIFGDRPLAYILLQVLQAAAGVGLVYLVYSFTLVAWNEETALVAAAITAVYPPLVYMPAEMHSINFYVVLTLAVVYYLYLFLEGAPRTVYVVWAGLLLGVLTYFRAEALALPFIYGTLLIVKSRHNVRMAVILLLLPLLMLAPWAIRNYRTFGRLILTTTAGGINLWYGHNLHANGTQHELWPSGKYVMPDAVLQSKIDALPPATDYELRLSSLYRQAAMQFIRTHPWREVELIFRKLFYFWTIDWNHPKARHVVYALPALTVAVLFWVGVVVHWRDLFGRYLLVTATILFANLLALVFFVLPRYRLVVEPMMIPFAASAVLWIVGVWRARGVRTVALPSDEAAQPAATRL